MATLDLSLSPPRHPEFLLAWLARGLAVASHSRNPFKGRGSPGGLELLWSLPCRSPLACEQSCFLPSLGSSGLKLGGTLWDREDTRAGRTCGWLLPKYRVGGTESWRGEGLVQVMQKAWALRSNLAVSHSSVTHQCDLSYLN